MEWTGKPVIQKVSMNYSNGGDGLKDSGAIQGRGRFKAQSLVEFGLVLPIMVLLIMGTIDLGRLFYVKIALSSAAREGAYYLSYYPGDSATCDPLNPGQCYQGTWTAVQNEANNLGLNVVYANMVITVYDPAGNPKSPPINQGDTVQVTVNQSVDLFIFNFIRGPVPLGGAVQMLVQSK